MTQDAEPSSQRRAGRTSLLAPLTTFRFFAALAIVVFHVSQRSDYGFLATGVSFFFVLSGFVLTYVHPKLDAPGSYGRFWIARFSRVWPLHFFTFLVVLFLQPFGPPPFHHFGLEAFVNVFLLQCWIPVHRVCQSFNFVSWSLSVEMFFYATFPLLLPRVARMPVRMIIGAVALNIFLTIAAILAGLPEDATNNAVTFGAFRFCPALHLFEFVLGMAVAVWWMNSKRGFAGPRPAFRWIEVLVFVGVIAVVPFVVDISRVQTLGHTRHMLDRQVASFIYAALFALLIFVFAYQEGILSRLFSQPWLVYLGEVSFSIYMIHCIVLEPYRRLHWTEQPGLQWSVYGALLLGASALLYALLERPARKGVAAFLDRRLGLDRT